MQTLKSKSCWVAFDRNKRVVDAATGKYQLRLHPYHAVRRAVGSPEPLRDYYLGIHLGADTDCLCIDIDEMLTPSEIETIRQRIETAAGHHDFTMEYSMSGNLHIFLRIPFQEVPEPFRRAKGQFMGYPAEFYAAGQSVLLTENWIDGTKPLETIKQPIAWCAIAEWCKAEQPLHTTTKKPTQSLHQPKRHNIFLDIMHLFPSFYAPYLYEFTPEQTGAHHDRVHLRRPGKHKGISATMFLDTGVVYNFSTNWTELPHQQGLSLAQTIAQIHKMTLKQVAKKFYQYLTQTSRALGLPIPRRKNKLYYNIKKRHYYEFLICLSLLENENATIHQLVNLLQDATQKKISPVSLQKQLYELMQQELVQRNRIPNTNKYGYTLTQKGKDIIEALLKMQLKSTQKKKKTRRSHDRSYCTAINNSCDRYLKIDHLDIGWILIIFIMLLHSNQKEIVLASQAEMFGLATYKIRTPHRPFDENRKDLRSLMASLVVSGFLRWSAYFRRLRLKRFLAFSGFGSAVANLFVIQGDWDVPPRLMREAKRNWDEVYMRDGAYQAYVFLFAQDAEVMWEKFDPIYGPFVALDVLLKA